MLRNERLGRLNDRASFRELHNNIGVLLHILIDSAKTHENLIGKLEELLFRVIIEFFLKSVHLLFELLDLLTHRLLLFLLTDKRFDLSNKDHFVWHWFALKYAK